MRSLAIISQGKNTSRAVYEQINQLMGDRVEIRPYYLNGNIQPDIAADLILVTSEMLVPAVVRYMRPGCPYLVARRSINYYKIEKILDIQSGTKVLLVNESEQTAVETIALLKALGLDDLEYYPFAPDISEFPRLSLAITPGELELVPDFVKTVVDIKTRNLDFTTLVEILKALNLLDETANLLSATFMRDIIGLIKKTKAMANQNSRMAGQLQTLINTVQEGIVALDDRNRVSVFNPVAEKLLGISKNDILGKSAGDKEFSEQFRALLADDKAEAERFARVNERQLVINKAQIKEEDVQIGRVLVLRDVTEIERVEQELRRKAVKERNYARYYFEDIQGVSRSIGSTKELATKIAGSDSPVLIQGESGTGKELFAQSIHNASSRRNGPFIAVNFAALTESLLESELFGFSEGAFTGAKRGGAPGLFEQAHKGTIFLDEIGDAPLAFQIKLLRVLQEHQVRRVGGMQVIPIDVRVITASNKDLKELIGQGLFRQDLYYRLKVLTLRLPPLRERKEDILPLVKSMYLRLAKRRYFEAEQYFGQVIPAFLDYSWPGNIRELQNVVEYLINICPDEVPTLQHLPDEFITCNYQKPGKPQQEQTMQAIIAKIAAANQVGESIGRRKLAQEVGLSESRVRHLLSLLAQQGRIVVRRGGRGSILPGK